MNLRDRVFYSAVFRILGNLITIAIAFTITPFLIHNLGDEGYGLWLLIIAVLGWFRFVDLGFSSAVQRTIAIALENNDKERINVVFSCSVVLFGGLGAVATALVFALSFFPDLLGVDDQYHTTVQISLSILSLKLLWDVGMCCFHGFYSGLIRYDVDANINSANEIIKAFLLFLLVSDLNIYGAVVATMVSDFLTNIYKIAYARKIYPDFKFDLKLVSKEEFVKLYDYSKHVLAMVVANSFSNGTDALIISHLLGLGTVAVYGVARRLVVLVEQSFLTVLGLFLPVLTRLIEKKGDVSVEINQIFSLNFFLVSIFFTPLIILSEDFFLLWLGDGFGGSSLIVAALAIAYMCRSISRPVETLLLATAKHTKLSYVRLTQIVLNVFLSIVLGSAYGIEGIMVATIGSFYVCDVFLHAVLYKMYTSYNLRRVLWKFLLSNVMILILCLIGLEIKSEFQLSSWFGLFFAGGVFFSISVVLFWFAVMDKESKELILKTIYSKLKSKSSV